MPYHTDDPTEALRYLFRQYRGAIVTVVILALLAIGAGTTVFKIDADSEGVVLRFGRYVRTAPPGLHFKLPWPVEIAYPVPVQRVITEEFGFATVQPGRRTRYTVPPEQEQVKLMLTGDLSLINVEWILQYRIKDARDFLFRVKEVDDTIRDVSESVIRQLVGDASVDEVMTTGRAELEARAARAIQEQLDAFACGIDIVTLQLQDVQPPDPVKDAFDAVNKARQEKETMINNARGERNRRIPTARGQRDRVIAEAEGYASRVIQQAQGDAAAFLSQLAEYRKAPEATRLRLYIETMQDVLARVDRKVILDESLAGLLPLLNLTQPETTPASGAQP